MKNCTCGCIYPDDYAGSCGDCGRGMGSVSSGGAGLVWSAPVAAQRDAQMEQRINAKDHNNINFDRDDPIFSAARELVIDKRTPEQKARDERDGA